MDKINSLGYYDLIDIYYIYCINDITSTKNIVTITSFYTL